MAGWHQTIIIGNVGKNVDMRYTPNNVPVCSFSVAVTERWNDRDSHEKKEKTTWYNVTCWKQLAEIANEYVRKGMKIQVVGTVSVRAYKNGAGEPAASLDLTATSFQMLSRSNDPFENDGDLQSSDDDLW